MSSTRLVISSAKPSTTPALVPSPCTHSARPGVRSSKRSRYRHGDVGIDSPLSRAMTVESEAHRKTTGDSWQVAETIREAPLATEVAGVNPANSKSPTLQTYRKWARPCGLAHLSTVTISGTSPYSHLTASSRTPQWRPPPLMSARGHPVRRG